MTDRFRRSWSAFLTWAKLRPPRGHMDMLREEVGRRDDARLARDKKAVNERHALRTTELLDVSD